VRVPYDEGWVDEKRGAISSLPRFLCVDGCVFSSVCELSRWILSCIVGGVGSEEGTSRP